MPIKTPKELFVMLLSDARLHTERAAKIFQEISQHAEDPDVKEALESRAWISEKHLAVIDRCFQVIGEQPVTPSGRLQEAEVFVEEFRARLAEIQNPVAKHLFLLAKASHLAHLRIAEHAVLVEAAGVTGHYGVGVLLETILADKIAFVERTRHIVRNIVLAKVAAAKAGA